MGVGGREFKSLSLDFEFLQRSLKVEKLYCILKILEKQPMRYYLTIKYLSLFVKFKASNGLMTCTNFITSYNTKRVLDIKMVKL